MSHASYNFCATDIVLATGKPSFLLASCWIVDVVNGADGDLLPGFVSTFFTVNSDLDASSKKVFASSILLIFLFTSAVNAIFLYSKVPTIL